MSTLNIMVIDEICQRGSVRDSDVATLRRTFSRDPHVGPSAIDALLRINSLARIQHPSWTDFFIATVTDYVVRELEPAGYVTAAHAGWLIARVSSGGRVRTKTEHDLLVNVIDKARWVPESLLVYTLRQIRDAVATGEGPLRIGGVLAPATLTAREIDQIRRILFAYGTEGPSTLTAAEADLLLDIDAALGGNPGNMFNGELTDWTDLLVKCMTSAILGASGYVAASREETLIDRSLPTAVPGTLAAYRQLSTEQRALARLERQRIEIITGEPVTDVDALHLAARLARHPGSRIEGLTSVLSLAGFVLHPAFGHTAKAASNAA